MTCKMGPLTKHKKDWKPRTFTEKIAWDQGKSTEFQEFFTREETVNKLGGLADKAERDPEGSLDEFNTLLRQAGEHMKKTVGSGGRGRKANCKWFDGECRDLKKDAQRTLHKWRVAVKYNRSNKDEIRTDYLEKRANYKSMTHKKKSD